MNKAKQKAQCLDKELSLLHQREKELTNKSASLKLLKSSLLNAITAQHSSSPIKTTHNDHEVEDEEKHVMTTSNQAELVVVEEEEEINESELDIDECPVSEDSIQTKDDDEPQELFLDAIENRCNALQECQTLISFFESDWGQRQNEDIETFNIKQSKVKHYLQELQDISMSQIEIEIQQEKNAKLQISLDELLFNKYSLQNLKPSKQIVDWDVTQSISTMKLNSSKTLKEHDEANMSIYSKSYSDSDFFDSNSSEINDIILSAEEAISMKVSPIPTQP